MDNSCKKMKSGWATAGWDELVLRMRMRNKSAHYCTYCVKPIEHILSEQCAGVCKCMSAE